MRLRALFVAVVCLVATFALVGTAYATPSPRISGQVGEEVDAKASATDALRYVGKWAPSGFSHEYQWARPFITTSPDDAPVAFTGTLVLDDAEPGSTSMIGLVDLASLEDGSAERQVGAFLYVLKTAGGDVRFSVTDGNVGGEVAQRYIVVPAADVPEDGEVEVTFTVDGDGDVDDCASHDADADSADGCMTLDVDGFGSVEDSYGSITAEGFDDEFADGAVAGWEIDPAEGVGVSYDLTISPADVSDEPGTKPHCKKHGHKGGHHHGKCFDKKHRWHDGGHHKARHHRHRHHHHDHRGPRHHADNDGKSHKKSRHDSWKRHGEHKSGKHGSWHKTRGSGWDAHGKSGHWHWDR